MTKPDKNKPDDGVEVGKPDRTSTTEVAPPPGPPPPPPPPPPSPPEFGGQ